MGTCAYVLYWKEEMSEEEYDQKLLSLLRKTEPNRIAQELVNVQPIDPKFFEMIRAHSMSEEELIENGYEPIDPQTKLMWKKRKDG